MADTVAYTALQGRYLQCIQGSSTATKCNGLTRMIEICALLCANGGRRGQCAQYARVMSVGGGHIHRLEADYDIHETTH